MSENSAKTGSLAEPCAARGPPLGGLGASWVALGPPREAYGWPKMAREGFVSEIRHFASIFQPFSSGQGDDFETIFGLKTHSRHL